MTKTQTKKKPAAKKSTAKKQAAKKPSKKIAKKTAPPDISDSRVLAGLVADIAGDHKALDVVVLDMKKIASFTDYFVICSGSSDRQVQAIADAIHHDVKVAGRKPLSEEGIRAGRWALIDYGDVVAHIFYHADRDHYQLERLWYDAPHVSAASSRKSA